MLAEKLKKMATKSIETKKQKKLTIRPILKDRNLSSKTSIHLFLKWEFDKEGVTWQKINVNYSI